MDYLKKYKFLRLPQAFIADLLSLSIDIPISINYLKRLSE